MNRMTLHEFKLVVNVYLYVYSVWLVAEADGAHFKAELLVGLTKVFDF